MVAFQTGYFKLDSRSLQLVRFQKHIDPGTKGFASKAGVERSLGLGKLIKATGSKQQDQRNRRSQRKRRELWDTSFGIPSTLLPLLSPVRQLRRRPFQNTRCSATF